ncbi:MAG: hypothetical protein ACE5PM_02380 [Candidatus Hydrothermarchaeales archaeon]
MPFTRESTRKKIIVVGTIVYLAAGLYVLYNISRFWGWIILGVGFADITISNFLMRRWREEDRPVNENLESPGKDR